MAKDTRKKAELSRVVVGIDVSDKWSYAYVLGEEDGSREARFRTRPASVRKFFEEFPARVQVVLEVGTHSPWMAELVEGLGHEVLVADPSRLALISRGKKKSDRLDAETLARLGAADPKLLSPVRHRPEEVRLDVARLRERAQLVQERARLVRSVRGTVKSFGELVPGGCSTAVFARRAVESVSEKVLGACPGRLRMIQDLTEEIREADRWIARRIREAYPEAELLQGIPGVGPVVSLTFVLMVVDPRRFRNGRVLAAYIGLTPRLHESGEMRQPGRLSRTGDAELRRVLIQAAHHVLGAKGRDSRLRRWGLAVEARRGKKKAVAAVARKLAMIMYRMWLTGEPWDPERGLRQAA